MLAALGAFLVFLQGAPEVSSPAEALPAPGGMGDPRDGRFGIRLVEAPVARRDDPRARTGIVDHLKPGTTIARRIEISNMSGARLDVRVYPAAASISRHRLAFAPGATPNELTTWTSVDHRALRLPAYGSQIARVIIRVPDTASKGERYGVVWAEAGAAADAEHNVGVVNRVGIPLYLDIGPGGEPASDMQIDELFPARAKGGRPQVVARVRNTGGRALVISGSLRLSDGPGGLRAGPFSAADSVTLVPGDTAPVTVTLDQRLPNGPWHVRLTLKSGMITRTVEARLTFPDAGTGKPVRPLSASSLHTAAALAGGTAVGATVLYVLRRRRRRRAESAD